MEETLHVTPAELQSVSSSFATKATQVKALHDEMIAAVKSVGWEGKAAETYKENFSSLQTSMNDLYEEIMSYSSKLSKIADEYIQVEEQNVIKSGL